MCGVLTNDHMAIGQLQPFLLYIQRVCVHDVMFYQIIGKRQDCVPKTYRWIPARYEMLVEIFHFYFSHSARSPFHPALVLSLRSHFIRKANLRWSFPWIAVLCSTCLSGDFLCYSHHALHPAFSYAKYQAYLYCIIVGCMCRAPAATTVADYYFRC